MTSTEVFEHVPNDIQGFQEIFRILKKGGRLVFTVPITENRDTIERAIRKPNGSVEHLLEPEYHTDRFRGKQRVLAYRTYGKDLVKRLESAGFVAEMRTVVSHENRINGVIVTIAEKMASGEYPD